VYTARGRRSPGLPNVAALWGRCDAPTRLALLVCATFATLALTVALVAPPNSWDAMTYHMARVAHWLANGSLRHYPTFLTPNLFMPPFNAYAIASVQVLAGSDRFANLVSWLAYVGGAVAVSLAAGRLGAALRTQAIAAVLFMTIPVAAAQAPTAMADLLNAFWVVTLVAFVVDRPSWRNAVCIGALVGVGMMSKLTFSIYAAPFLLWLARRWAAHPARTGGTLGRPVLVGAVIAAIAAALFAPHALRNLGTFGSPLNADDEAVRNANEIPGPRALASNVLRDTVLHLPVPGYGHAVVRAHRLIGLDPDDPRTTHLFDSTFTSVADHWTRPLTPTEAVAGSPLHLIAACALGVAALIRPRRTVEARFAAIVAVAALLGWLLTQIPFKWQPWWSRFDMPFYAVLAIPTGIMIAGLPSRLAVAVLTSFVLGALPALVLAVHRPLIDVAAIAGWPAGVWSALTVGLVALGALVARTPTARVRGMAYAFVVSVGTFIGVRGAAYVLAHEHDIPPMSVLTADRDAIRFRQNRELQVPYERAAARVLASHCDVVGLEMLRDQWEYPLWVLLGAAAGSGPRIRSIGVRNQTAALPPEGPEPCVVISTVDESILAGAAGWSPEPIAEDPRVVVYWRRMPPA
jgi:hypothetical protein